MLIFSTEIDIFFPFVFLSTRKLKHVPSTRKKPPMTLLFLVTISRCTNPWRPQFSTSARTSLCNDFNIFLPLSVSVKPSGAPRWPCSMVSITSLSLACTPQSFFSSARCLARAKWQQWSLDSPAILLFNFDSTAIFNFSDVKNLKLSFFNDKSQLISLMSLHDDFSVKVQKGFVSF